MSFTMPAIFAVHFSFAAHVIAFGVILAIYALFVSSPYHRFGRK